MFRESRQQRFAFAWFEIADFKAGRYCAAHQAIRPCDGRAKPVTGWRERLENLSAFEIGAQFGLRVVSLWREDVQGQRSTRIEVPELVVSGGAAERSGEIVVPGAVSGIAASG
jgi:hypothetical protein